MSEANSSSPESYIRINIAQNSKGFTYETTVSHRWDGHTEDGEWWDTLDNLLASSRLLALAEIKQREGEGS